MSQEFSSTLAQTVGDTVFTWEEREPLKFHALTQYGAGAPKYPQAFDLTSLIGEFSEALLLGLKDLVMQRHLKVKVLSIRSEYSDVLQLLKKIQSAQVSFESGDRLLNVEEIAAIDPSLMLAITARLAEDPSWIRYDCISRLSDWFRYTGNGSVFKGIDNSNFPRPDRTGAQNLYRQRIISTALSRTLQIAVLVDLERRFQSSEISLGIYSLWNLTNFLYARPESLRQIRCRDLVYDEDRSSGEIRWTLWLMPAKRGGRRPKRMAYSLTPFLGQLLFKQQVWVVENAGPIFGWSHDLDPTNRQTIEQNLALFPRINKGDRRTFELEHYGMLMNSSDLIGSYLHPIQKGLKDIHVDFNTMRHTIGTQLAAAGVSVSVIQAVLRHATDGTARVYIDLAAKELREALNSGLESLEKMFPAYNAFVDAAQARDIGAESPGRVVSSQGSVDPDTGEKESQTAGICGNATACSYAPLSCYGCWRWIPNIDADHQVNLIFVRNRIGEHAASGKQFKALVDRDRLLEKVIMLRIGQIERHKAEVSESKSHEDALP
jgi:hypothetical protein